MTAGVCHKQMEITWGSDVVSAGSAVCQTETKTKKNSVVALDYFLLRLHSSCRLETLLVLHIESAVLSDIFIAPDICILIFLTKYSHTVRFVWLTVARMRSFVGAAFSKVKSQWIIFNGIKEK